MNDLIRDSLDHCVKCTICETYCPVSQATPLFPGPKYVGPQAERYRGAGPSSDASVDYCSGCGICTQVCPQDVKIAEINSRARAKLWEKRGIPLRNQLIAFKGAISHSSASVPVMQLADLVSGQSLRSFFGHSFQCARRGTAPSPRSTDH